jgi:hypothetical protein
LTVGGGQSGEFTYDTIVKIAEKERFDRLLNSEKKEMGTESGKKTISSFRRGLFLRPLWKA